MRSVMLGLLILVASNQPRPQTAKEQLESIQRAQTEASEQYRQWVGSKTEEQRQKVVTEFLAKVVVNSDRALELARGDSGDSTALDALIFVIRTAGTGPSDRSEKAIEMMAHDHARDERMGDVCPKIFHFFHLLAAERTLAEFAEGELFELRHLKIGAVAPDIDGEDVDGKRLKLSD